MKHFYLSKVFRRTSKGALTSSEPVSLGESETFPESGTSLWETGAPREVTRDERPD